MSSAQSTLWSQDSPASLSVLRVSAVVRMMTDGSGRRYTGSFDARGPLGYFWRTFLTSSTWDSIPFSATWSARATRQRRVFIRLQRLERRTSENAFLSWLTPATSDANGIRELDGKRSGGLNTQVIRMWPTPTVNGNDNYKGASPTSGDGLTTVVKMWPTPQERDYRTGSPPDSPRMARKQAQGWSPNLNDVAGLWSTPAAQDSKNATLPVSQATRDTLPGDLLRDGAAGKLNPAWVCLLQGFPPNWLDVETK